VITTQYIPLYSSYDYKRLKLEVENNGRDWVEPFVKQRTYICADGKHQNFVNKSLGPYPAGEQRKGGIRDNGVCQGSKIESVKTDIELRPVSEKIRKMWE
jgi:hypothetical protein